MMLSISNLMLYLSFLSLTSPYTPPTHYAKLKTETKSTFLPFIIKFKQEESEQESLPSQNANQNQSYVCSIVDFRSHWACNLQGVMIAQDFFIRNQSSISLSSYPYQAINEITIFESYEKNIIVPHKYLPFFIQYYYNGFNCSMQETKDDTQFECDVVEAKDFPPVLFFIQDFGISFEEYYSTFFKTIKSKFVFRKGLKHWILGNEFIKKYTLVFNKERNSISFSSKSDNDIIPFKWPEDPISISKFNTLMVLSFLLLFGIGLTLTIVINKTIVRRPKAMNSIIIEERKESGQRLIEL